MKRTPATTIVLAGCSWPKRAISSESDTVPPVACGEVLQVRVDVVVRDQDGVALLQELARALDERGLLARGRRTRGGFAGASPMSPVTRSKRIWIGLATAMFDSRQPGILSVRHAKIQATCAPEAPARPGQAGRRNPPKRRRPRETPMRQLLLDFTRAPEPTFANFVPGGNAELLARARRGRRAGARAERVLYLWGESGRRQDPPARSRLRAAARRGLAARRPRRSTAWSARRGRRRPSSSTPSSTAPSPSCWSTARCAPRDLPLRRDLATRLATGPHLPRARRSPTSEKRAALAAHARARGFELSDEVASYLLTHARRDMGSLMSALDALDRYSLETAAPDDGAAAQGGDAAAKAA